MLFKTLTAVGGQATQKGNSFVSVEVCNCSSAILAPKPTSNKILANVTKVYVSVSFYEAE
jgi:hypothetical protein